MCVIAPDVCLIPVKGPEKGIGFPAAGVLDGYESPGN